MHLQAKRQRNYVARRKIEARERGTERAKQVVCWMPLLYMLSSLCTGVKLEKHLLK
jgi:hypothetical protein